MKHARPDYDRIQDPHNIIPADEPVFLLRAQDELAANVVDTWADLYRKKYGNSEIADLAETQARKMENWPKKKRPDLQK